MPDEILRLCSAFLLERMNVDRPDFLVKSDEYSWRIHRHLLYRLSRDKDKFLKKVSVSTESFPCYQQLNKTQGNGSITKIADFSPEDPWMVARLIQFLYTNTYDVHYIETCDPDYSLECSLENVLQDHKKENPKTFTEDKERDHFRSELRVHLMMCELASVYDMPALVDHALHRAFQSNSNQGEMAAEEMLKATATITGIHNICKSDKLRKVFATFIIENRRNVSEDMIRQWLRGDGTFAIEVVDCLMQKNLELEKQIVATEVPPNLKKRRPSIELIQCPAEFAKFQD